jgi:NAD(P)-dependent dehydrogenase (short-subunit alcohol dehydrogenase family)
MSSTMNRVPMTNTKTAVITGSSRPEGLGFAVARELAGLSFHVILTSRALEKAETLAGQLRADGHSASAVALDLTDSASITACAGSVRGRFEQLDVLINNSSTVPDFDTHSILDVDVEQARNAYATNVLGPWQLTQDLLPLLRNAPAARIVNVSSPDALQVAAGTALTDGMIAPAFSVAKYTLNALTASLAAALKGTPILVNAVDPGTTATHPESDGKDDGRPATESAHGVVWAALLGADGPTGGFYRDRQPLS